VVTRTITKGLIMELHQLLNTHTVSASGRDIAQKIEAGDIEPDDSLLVGLRELLGECGYAVDADDLDDLIYGLENTIVRIFDRDGMVTLVDGEALSVSTDGTALGRLDAIIDYGKAIPVVADNLDLVESNAFGEPVWVEAS